MIHQRNVVQDKHQEKAEDRKHMNQMIAVVATGYSKLANKKRGERRHKEVKRKLLGRRY